MYVTIGNSQIHESVLEMKRDEFDKTYKDSKLNTNNLWKAVQAYKKKGKK